MQRTERTAGSIPPAIVARRKVDEMKSAISLGLVVLVLLLSGRAHAAPTTIDVDALTTLVSAVAEAEQNVHRVQALAAQDRERVNAFIADAAQARVAADEAHRNELRASGALGDAEGRLDLLQKGFDRFAAASYVYGPIASAETIADPAELMATAALTESIVLSRKNAADDLSEARTRRVDDLQRARAAAAESERALVETEKRRADAVRALANSQHAAADWQRTLNELVAQRNQLQERLDAVTGSHENMPQDPSPVPVPQSSSDPTEAVDRLLALAETSSHATAAMGRTFLARLSTSAQDIPALPARPTSSGPIPVSAGRRASEYVIARALTQRGVDYSWGGGTATGPSRGIGGGADTVGFDCSGLILYAFAGVGIELPHFSGRQYELGRKIPVAQMRRGDVVFYGEGGGQHVALYLGDNVMVEAPTPGGVVTVSPLRTSDMAPYAVRYIES